MISLFLICFLSPSLRENMSLNSYFHILNNITYISIHFFTYTYFKKL